MSTMRRLRPVASLSARLSPFFPARSAVVMTVPTLQNPALHQSTSTSASGIRSSSRSSGEKKSAIKDVSASPLSEAQPEYHNFATRNAFLRRSGALNVFARRSKGRSGIAEEEQMLRQRTLPPNPADPPGSPPIFRKDMESDTAAWSKAPSMPLSVNVTAKRLHDMFCDFDSKRCKLCNETFVHWHVHASGIPHAGREGILMELLRPFCGTPEEQIYRWNHRLHRSTAFGRIPALSDVDNNVRKRKLKYLLFYLKDRGVLADVFNVASNNPLDAARSFEFERLEFVGDGVVKYVLNNVMNEVLPVSEGGFRGKVANFQFVMDGNDGLARGYDFLELQDLTLSTRVVSKFKSDVVETLFGELQFYLWTTELDTASGAYTFPFSKDIYALRALVRHVMYETAITLFMYHAEYIAGMLQRVVREEQLQFVRADPSLRNMQRGGSSLRRGVADGDDTDDSEDFYGGGRHGGGSNHGGGSGGMGQHLVTPAPTTKLMKLRVARAHLQGGSNASFLESTNYDSYKRVVPLGGLLPIPFAPEQLSVIPNYLPHVQRDAGLTQQVRTTEAVWRAALEDALAEDVKKNEASEFPLAMERALCLSSKPTKRLLPTVPPLSVARLKDEELIAELI